MLVHPSIIAPYGVINFAARSAIISVGEAVLPEVRVGITEASAMRSPSSPMKRISLSTTALGSSKRPILQVPTGWKMVVPMSPAARARSSSVWYCGPGRNSSGA